MLRLRVRKTNVHVTRRSRLCAYLRRGRTGLMNGPVQEGKAGT